MHRSSVTKKKTNNPEDRKWQNITQTCLCESRFYFLAKYGTALRNITSNSVSHLILSVGNWTIEMLGSGKQMKYLHNLFRAGNELYKLYCITKVFTKELEAVSLCYRTDLHQ